VSQAELNRIREAVASGRYYLTDHANEEMIEDDLDVLDVETSILNGVLKRTQGADPRGTVYTIHGTGSDQETPLGTVGRFTASGQYRVITIYKVIPREGER